MENFKNPRSTEYFFLKNFAFTVDFCALRKIATSCQKITKKTQIGGKKRLKCVFKKIRVEQNLNPKILVLNGPNLNLLGAREPALYGNLTLDSINEKLNDKARAAGIALEFFQSNAEGALIDRIHAAFAENVSAIIFNPAAFTHTSVALRDALLAVKIPFVEVHLTNIFGRDDFRQKSFFSDIAEGVVSGFGAASYFLALEFFTQKFQ